MKTWQITNMLIYIKHITELKRFASSSDAIVGFRAHKRSEKLVKIKIEAIKSKPKPGSMRKQKI